MEHGPVEVIFAKLYQYVEVMGQFGDTKVMFIPSFSIILVSRLGYDLVSCFKPILMST